MVDRSSREERLPSVVPKPIVQPNFVNTMPADARPSVQLIPEISDQELLEMAIKFEMEHSE